MTYFKFKEDSTMPAFPPSSTIHWNCNAASMTETWFMNEGGGLFNRPVPVTGPSVLLTLTTLEDYHNRWGLENEDFKESRSQQHKGCTKLIVSDMSLVLIFLKILTTLFKVLDRARKKVMFYQVFIPVCDPNGKASHHFLSLWHPYKK